MILLLAVGCKSEQGSRDPAPPGREELVEVPDSTSPPTGIPDGPYLPVGDAWIDEAPPLVEGTASALGVVGAPSNVNITWWQGGFGGITCPDTLDGCLPIAEAEVFAVTDSGTSGWAYADFVPRTPPGSYVVFTATVEQTRTLPVMRRVWPETGVGDPAARDLVDVMVDPTRLVPGDWLDLMFEEEGDSFVVETRGHQVLTAEATFVDVDDAEWDQIYSAPGRDSSLEVFERSGESPSPWLTAQSLESGGWFFSLQDEGVLLGRYDLRIRVEEPPVPIPWYADTDGDAFGADETRILATSEPEGHTFRDGDCDDADPDIGPEAWDTCEDGRDQDCTGSDKVCRGVARAEEAPAHEIAGLRVEVDGLETVDAVGDIDGDGVSDLWITGTSGELDFWTEVGWWSVPGTPGAAARPAVRPRFTHEWTGTRRTDVDRDGVADLVLVQLGYDDRQVLRFLSPPLDLDAMETAIWGTVNIPPPEAHHGAGAYALDAGDVDGDGAEELVVSDEDRIWLLGAVPPGDWLFEEVAAGSVEEPGSLVVADLDGDGVSDLATGFGVHLGPLVGTIPFGSHDVPYVDWVALELWSGDTNGDGLDELRARVWDAVPEHYVFADPLGAELALDDATTTLDGTAPFAQLDLDGDGAEDLIVDGWAEFVWSLGVVWGPLPPTLSVEEDVDQWLLGRDGYEEYLSALRVGDADGDGAEDLLLASTPDDYWVFSEPPPEDPVVLDVIYGAP